MRNSLFTKCYENVTSLKTNLTDVNKVKNCPTKSKHLIMTVGL